MYNLNKLPIWSLNEQQRVKVGAIVQTHADEQGLRDGLEYHPDNCSIENPVLIQEYFRLFLSSEEIGWEGELDPKDDYQGEASLVKRIREVVPGFASSQSERTHSQ